MVNKGKISSFKGGKAIVIPYDTKDAVTCPLTVPVSLSERAQVGSNVAYAMWSDGTGILLEVF